MKTKWMLAGIAVLAISAWSYWTLSTPNVPEGTPPADPTPTNLTAEGTKSQDTMPVRSEAQLDPIATERSPDFHGITVRGRCIDGVSREPAAGIQIALRGRGPYGRRQVGFTDPPTIVSKPDGRFVMRVEESPRRLELVVTSPGCVEMSAWWDDVALGSDLDVGDVVVGKGCAIHGRVVDGSGKTCPDVEVAFLRDSGGYTDNKEKIAPTGDKRIVSDASGAFRLYLPPGKWIWFVEEPYRTKVVVPVPSIEITATDQIKSVRVELLRVFATIRGQVVDPAGRPIEEAKVYIPEASTPRRLSPIHVYTDAEGRFRLPRIEDWPATAVEVRVKIEAFESGSTGQTVNWGRDDLRFVLKPLEARPVEVLVIDSNNHPIGDYAIRIAPDPKTTRKTSSHAWRLQHSGYHTDGRLVFSCLTGKHILTVEPADRTLATPWPQTFELTTTNSPSLRFELAPRVTRQLQVIDDQDHPIAGTKVELLRPMRAGALRLGSDVRPFANVPSLLVRTRDGLRLQTATTDERGELQLVETVTSDRPIEYALRLLGPGHIPQLTKSITISPKDEVLRVVVHRGATVTGKIGPPEARARMFPSGKDAELIAGLPHYAQPHLRLKDPATGRWFPSGRSRVLIAPDGSFRAEQVPPGDWQVRFSYSLRAMDQLFQFPSEIASIRGLKSGEVRVLDLDASALVPGTLRARVFLDGEPIGRANLTLVPSVPRGQPRADRMFVGTHDSGILTVPVSPGRYAVSLEINRDGKKVRVYSAASPPVPAGGELEHVFRITAGPARVRILTASGEPFTGQPFYISNETVWRQVGTTDVRGEIVIDPLPVPSPCELVTWPASMRDPQKRRIRQRANPHWRDELIRVGPIRTESNRPRAVQILRMPR